MLVLSGSSFSAEKREGQVGEELHPESMTREEMREADRRAIEEFSIPGIVLMENAALVVVREVVDAVSFTVVCGAEIGRESCRERV